MHLPCGFYAIHQAFRPNCERFGFTPQNYPTCAAYLTLEELRQEKASGTHIYGIMVDGVLAGCVQLKKTAPGIYAFRRFAVLPAYQNLGLGKELVNHCRAKAIEYGGETMHLLMVYENESLRHFYESCGFTLKKTCRDDAHPFLCGIYEMSLHDA